MSATLQIISNHFTQTLKRLACHLNEEEDPPRYCTPLDYMVFVFDLDSWSEERCLEYFTNNTFEKCDIISLSDKLGLENLVYPHGIKPSHLLAFCIVLACLSSPTHYKVTLYLFGCSQAYQSIVFNSVISFLYNRFKNILHWDRRRLTLEMIKSYAHAIQGIGGPENIWGFIDGTLRSICRPEQSGVEEILQDIFSEIMEQGRLFLYGDPAYSLSFGIICPFKNTIFHQLTQEEKAFNAKMSGYRSAIEHSFRKVVNLWSFIAFKNGLQIGLSPIGSYYAIAVLLTNLHTCLYGSQISLHFKVIPPSVDSYLNLEF
ncbi:hypothetical protein L873DRAFT_1826563 [Choiromyces venosus 120613-1]|uniref:DDE Tnp4 domain-containing protein n=1 Tax=Choiromyces venosus 120613-1 TaxID=1336337 RepID=A0A3N4K9Y1_9PEZI|nr:hypothetical protein L873DRAFT_1826563 [Choiromyces venosus 120613-1]